MDSNRPGGFFGSGGVTTTPWLRATLPRRPRGDGRSPTGATVAWLLGRVRTGAVVALIGGWALFWGAIARYQYSQGEPLSAAVVAALFVLPAILAISDVIDPLPDVERVGVS